MNIDFLPSGTKVQDCSDDTYRIVGDSQEIFFGELTFAGKYFYELHEDGNVLLSEETVNLRNLKIAVLNLYGNLD